MIAYIKGNVLRVDDSAVVIENANIGYLFYVPQSYLEEIKVGDIEVLHVYTHVREDDIKLFGFRQMNEFRLFEVLLKVSGIGPKTALAVINKGVLNVNEAIKEGKVEFFKDIPRLGRKNAQKIILELGSKLSIEKAMNTKENSENKAVITALTKMGFSNNEALQAVSQFSMQNMPVKEKLTKALQILGQR